MLRRTECSSIFLKRLLLTSPCQKQEGFFFSEIHCENQEKLLKVKPPKVWGPPYVQFPLEFSTLRTVHTEPSAIHQLQFRFSYPSTGSMEVSVHEFLPC